MAVQASFTYNQASDRPASNEFNHIFLNSDIADEGTSNPDHLVFVNDFPDDVNDSWDETGDLSCSLAQENGLGLDDFGLHGNEDSTSLDNWCEASGTEFDPPMFQTGDQSFDPFLDPSAVELPMSWEGHFTDATSYNAIPLNPSKISQPMPDLIERLTPTSLSTPNNSLDASVGSLDKFSTEDQRWHATQSRSRVADRYFLYGVLTTKIFCRPSCASRRPSRRHIVFFSFPRAVGDAKQARFRPCKRCKPETLGTVSTGVLAISQVIRKIVAETFEQRSEAKKGDLKLESLARSAGLSAFHFHRLFKATTQVTPAGFITACHALALQDALSPFLTGGTRQDPNTVKLSPRWSERTARKALGGVSPQEYANGANSRSMEYCRVSAPTGDLEVAYSRDKSISNVNVHAVVILQDCSSQTDNRFKTVDSSEDHAQRLQQCVRELEEKCQDRDAELAADVLSVLWRARLWLKVTQDNVLG